MEKELWINRKKLIMERDAAGTLKFFRILPSEQKFKIVTCKEDLVDVLDSTLWPLDSLKCLFDQEESPGPLYYLLDDMLKTLGHKFEALCEMLEEEFGGRITVYTCDDVVPGVPKGTFLCAAGTGIGPSQEEVQR